MAGWALICNATNYCCGPFDSQKEAEEWKRYSNNKYRECLGHEVIKWKDRPGAKKRKRAKVGIQQKTMGV